MFPAICFNLDQSKILCSGNGLTADKSLPLSKMKASSDNKCKVVQVVDFVLNRGENIVGKGENAGNHHFLLFPHNVFKCFLFSGCRNSGFCG